MVLRTALLLLFGLLSTAWAGTANTRDSLDRLEEIIELRIEDGHLDPTDVMPAIIVSLEPRYEASEGWFAARAIQVLERNFGNSGLRLCEACMAPRAFVEDGHMVYQTGPVGLDEIVRLDQGSRGDAQPARSAIWIEEHQGGVSIRIVDLRNGGVLYAQNVDPNLVEYSNTQRLYSLSAELERRARGDSLTQAFVDVTIFPGQHMSMDWTDQWGKTNANLSGVTLSVFDPVVGLGGCHYRRIDFVNMLIGAKGILSMPTALVQSLGDNDVTAIDPLFTGVGVVRVPFGRSNYGAVFSVSTNGRAGIGISLMNITLLPVIL